MARMILRRLLLAVPTLVIVSALTFGLLHMTPGDPARVIAGPGASAEQLASVRERLGLDRPLIEQFSTWVADSFSGHLGQSLYNRLPVSELIVQRLPVTLSLVVLAMLIAVAIGVPLGLLAGMRKDRALDRALTIFAVSGVAVPSFFLGLVLLALLTGDGSIFPVGGYTSFTEDPWQWFMHLVLPAFTLSLPPMAEIARQMRSGVVDVSAREYVRSAEAKGLRPVTVAVKHIARNASMPVVTVFGLQLSHIIGSAVIVETVFNMPGVGTLLIHSVFQRDMPVVQGTVLFTTLVVVLVNLAVDMWYGWLDPRVRAAGGTS
ncbi:ABC transporter permease [Actinophytocola sp.]|uniref:ABC transporter permease n=1 Tax=Actinophytocola sp. TaxID=1872138 RepID=UPI003D6A1686